MHVISKVSQLTDLVVDGDLHVENCAEPLPEGLTVNGSLSITNSRARYLPSDLTIQESLFLENCAFVAVPKNLVVGWSLHVTRCPNLRELPAMTVKGNIKLVECDALETVHLGVRVNGERMISGCALRELPMDWFSVSVLTLDNCQRLESISALRSAAHLTVVDCPNVRELPDRLRVGTLELEHCPGLAAFGGIVVEKTAYLFACENLSSLGNAQIFGDLVMTRCPRLKVDPQDHRVRGRVYLGGV